MAAQEKTLNDAVYETLNDVCYAEQQSVRALGKSAKATKLHELEEAFTTHREKSSHQVERLEQIFENVGRPARAKTCQAVKGIAAEMEEDLEVLGETVAGDAVLIGCAQVVEHYEIARYGMLNTGAKQLDMSDAADLLDKTLQEGKAMDGKLTHIAGSMANAQAASGESEPEEGEKSDDAKAMREAEADGGAKATAGTSSKSES